MNGSCMLSINLYFTKLWCKKMERKKSSGSAWRNVFYTDSIGAMLGIGWNGMNLLFSYVIDS